jgi:hypothetical protein
MVLEDSFGAQSVLQDFLSLIMRHWNVIADTLHSGDVFLPLLLEDDGGVAHANDWAKGFLRGMELRKADWAAFLDDEKHGGWLVPIFALAHEHNPDPEMRPCKEAISAEDREKLIVGAAAEVTGFTVTSKHSDRLRGSRLITLRPSVARCQRLGATIRVHVDQERNSSSAVIGPRSIKTASIYRCTAIWGAKLTYSTSPKALGPRSTRSSCRCT